MCKDGCKCALADLDKEPVLNIGDSVTVTCTICNGSGKNKYYNPDSPLETVNDPACWRCEGKGESTLTVKDFRCPACNESLLGDQIGLAHMSSYGSTHGYRQILIDRFDAAVAYFCPLCENYWEAHTNKVISEEAALTGSIDSFPHAPVDKDWFGNTASDPRGPGLDRLDLIEVDTTELEN